MGAVLTNVYNNYLTSYAPKSLTRFDTHKKSELRNVYNSIVKLNKESPWYLPTTSKETQHYAVDLKENARELHNTIAQLGGLEENGIFSKKNAYSSNEEVATVSCISKDTPQDSISEIKLEVEQLASPQENMGLFLSNIPTDLSADTYSFDVNINDMNYEFQFSINSGESNLDVQKRLVRLINNSDIGLKASLAESDQRTAIRLVSENTGASLEKPLLFTISDDHTSKASGAVKYFGLDYISHRPTNAHFSINDEERSTSSNHFTIGKQFEIELHGTTPEESPVTIGLKTDTESLTDNVVNLVSGYNDFIKAASSYIEQQNNSRKLIREFRSIVSNYDSSLESNGINLNTDGTLTVDTNLLRDSAEASTDISETFGYLKNLSTSLIQKSNQVSLNPMDYVDKKIVAYKNPGRNFASPYISSAYSGMLFNGYC